MQEPLTIVCWLWSKGGAWRPGMYEPKHVKALENMLWKHCTIPYRLVCVTDFPLDDFDCDTVPIWDSPITVENKRSPNCYRRLFLFGDEARQIFGEKVLSIDLDVIINGNIDSLITDDSFKALKGSVSFYNGSLWQVKPGKFNSVWSELNEDRLLQAQRTKIYDEDCGYYRSMYGSDQVWMSHTMGLGHPVWTEKDGVYQFLKHRQRVHDDAKMVFFAGQVKPWTSHFSEIYNQYI